MVWEHIFYLHHDTRTRLYMFVGRVVRSSAGTNAGADMRIGRLGCHRERVPLAGVPCLVQYINHRVSRWYTTRQA